MSHGLSKSQLGWLDAALLFPYAIMQVCILPYQITIIIIRLLLLLSHVIINILFQVYVLATTLRRYVL